MIKEVRNMIQGINMPAVYVADYVGVLLLLLILISRGWDLPGRKGESRILFILIVATMIDNLIDPFIFLADGKPGAVNHALVFYGNSFLFLYNLIVGTGVLALIVKHINKRISNFQYVTVLILTLLEVVLLLLNKSKPLVFSVDENNVYERGPLYFVYIAVAFYLMIYSLVVYFMARFKDGSVRFFPVWEFIIPIICGVAIQTVFYGLSTQPVSFAIAFCSIVICIQKEYLYIDKLTGVYNRYELDKIFKHYSRHRKEKFAAIMIDMNNFKMINDNYSHKEGDEALCAMANILVSSVANEGYVIRFAGDEFVLVIDSSEPDTVSVYCNRIREALDQYNRRSHKPYKLSAAMGGDLISVGVGDDFIKHIDMLMYDDKKEYYRTHDRRGQVGIQAD